MLYLNLLPPKNRAQIHYERIFRRAEKQGVYLFVLLIGMSAVLWYAKQDLNQQLEVLETRLDENKMRYTDLIQEVQSINTEVDQFKQIQSQMLPQSEVLARLVELVPKGVRITLLKLEGSGFVTLEGTFEDRDTAIAFKEQLEKVMLENIEFPIANLLQPKNGQFVIRGNLQETE